MKIIKYEFDNYIEVEYNNNIIRIYVSDIIPFISNQMTNHLTTITEEYMLWLENYIINLNG
jgi:hypothetical protein